jgi:hypothetical protein
MLLVPCISCRRHVREGERCPFCGATATTSVARRTAPRTGRMPRALVIASAVSTISAAIGAPACSGSETAPPATDTGTGTKDTGGGSDSTADSSGDDTTDGSSDDTGTADTGKADTGKDADAKDDGGIVPLYGAPPG